MAANITLIENIGSIEEAGSFANTATGGYFWGLIIIAIFFIILIKLMYKGVDKATATASFISLILCLSLLSLGWIPIYFPIIFSLILAGSLFYIKFSNR